MMTKTEGVTKLVMDEIKRRVAPGTPVTRRAWKDAYTAVRNRAIDTTILWLDKNITIER